MENASKAVLIAGAVILALLLVTFATIIYSNVKNSLGVAGVQIDNIVVQEYNSQYLAYDKEYVTGMEVKECISEVLYNNANSSNSSVFVTGLTVENSAKEILKYIAITTDTSGKKTAVNNNLSLGKISNASRYTTKIILAPDGLVQEIIFKIK